MAELYKVAWVPKAGCWTEFGVEQIGGIFLTDAQGQHILTTHQKAEFIAEQYNFAYMGIGKHVTVLADSNKQED